MSNTQRMLAGQANRILLPATALLFAGCVASPVSWVATTPRPTSDMYSCALREVNDRGYTVTGASRDGGFIAAEKRRDGMMNVVLGWEEVDRISASIFDDTVPGQRKVRITVDATRVSQGSSGRGAVAIGASEAAVADAEKLLSACAEGLPVRAWRTNSPSAPFERTIASHPIGSPAVDTLPKLGIAHAA